MEVGQSTAHAETASGITSQLASATPVARAASAKDARPTYRELARLIRSGGNKALSAIDRFAAYAYDPRDCDMIRSREFAELTPDQQVAIFGAVVPHPAVLADHLLRSYEHCVTRNDPHLPAIGGRGRLYTWTGSFHGRGLVSLHALTGDPAFSDKIVDVYRRLLALRDDALGLVDDVTRKVMPSWGVQLTPEVRACEVTATGAILLPVLELMWLLRDDEAARGRYGFEEIVATARQSIDCMLELGYEHKPSGGMYFKEPHSGRVEALNHTNLLGAACVYMAALTGFDVYREAAEKITNYFRADWRSEDEFYWWSYAPEPEKLGKGAPEAIWKAGVTLNLPIACNACSAFMSADELTRIRNTFLGAVIHADGAINHYISSQNKGAGKVTNELKAGTGERFIGSGHFGSTAPWIYLDAEDGEIFSRLRRAMIIWPELFPNGWYGGSNQSLQGLVRAVSMHASNRPSILGLPDDVIALLAAR